MAGADQERMEEVLKIKEQANQKFREGDFFSAKCLYAGALEMLERCCLHVERADETWEGIKNNMALCDLKRQEWTRVVDTTTEILTRNSTNTKALYRRGVARIGQGKYQEAQKDLKAVLELEPENYDARQKLLEVVKHLKSTRNSEKVQADKLRGFLRGERLDDTVAISEDGGVRKLHGNENAPLFSTWIKRSWLQPNSGVNAVLTVHVVMKTPGGKEIWNTRKPPGYLAAQQLGPQMALQPKPAQRPAEPMRWVLDDKWGIVFSAWNSAAKCMQMHELGKFEVQVHTMGPSVEPAISRCLERWLHDTPARRVMFKDVPEDVRLSACRRQALQILGLPEEFCMNSSEEPNASWNMEMELLDVSEYVDLHGDGRCLLKVLREGKKRLAGVCTVTEFSRVSAHFRIAKLLLNYSLKDTRMGLANTSDGLALREDKSKEPAEFVVGEGEVASAGDFVPPCISDCLLMPTGGVVEGMHFELILRDGVPVSHMEKAIFDAYTDGMYETMPDTTGPVSIRIEVEHVSPPTAGPWSSDWKGLESLQAERRRAEELECADNGRHAQKALKRWQRIAAWLGHLLQGRRWKLQGGAATGDSMYDLEWADEDGESKGVEQEMVAQAQRTPPQPSLLEVEDDLLKQLSNDELAEWAAAHAAIAAISARDLGDMIASRRHAQCAVQAAVVGQIAKEVEIKARSTFAARLMESGETAKALEVINAALALDPTNTTLRDQVALTIQQNNDRKSMDVKDLLVAAKKDLSDALADEDIPKLRQCLLEIKDMQLTWDVVQDTAIGKEVGRCAKHADSTVAEHAKVVIAKFHSVAKQQRPMWVR